MNTNLFDSIKNFLFSFVSPIIKLFSDSLYKRIEFSKKRQIEIDNAISECIENVESINDLRELYIIARDEDFERINVRDVFKRNKIKIDKIEKLLYPDYHITKNRELKEKIIKNIRAIIDKSEMINNCLDKCYKGKNGNQYHSLRVLTGEGKYETDFDKQINNLKKFLEEIY